MGSGGARARSGPPPNQFSARSEKREFTDLPAGGFDGYVPVFPLPDVGDGTRKREVQLWKRIWRYPQAVMWSREKWRQDAVAHYVRISIRVENGAKAAEVTAMLRLRDEIGLSPAGMALNGWRVAADQVGEKRSEQSAQSRRRGFKVV